MLFGKRMIQCKTKQANDEMTHLVAYHKAVGHIEHIRYELIKTMVQHLDVIIDIDTALFSPQMRLNPREYAEEIQKKLETYGIMYKISRSKKEVLDAGISRVFGMKSTKVSTTYRISFYIPNKALNYDLYQDLLANIGCKIYILKSDSEPEKLLELFYSGMIDDVNLSEVFYAYFYANEQLPQILIVTEHMDNKQINGLLDELMQSKA